MKKKVKVRIQPTHDENAPIRIMDYIGTEKYDFERIYNSIPTLPNDPVFQSKNRRHSPGMYQHLFFTTDEEIKNGDYALYNVNNESKRPNWVLFKCERVKNFEGVGNYYDDYHHIWCEKVVATTDRTLTLDAVPLIKDDFVEVFCEKYGIDEVYLEYQAKFSQITLKGWSTLKTDSGNYVTTHLIQMIFTREEVIKLFELLTYEIAQKIIGNRKIEYPYEHTIIPSEWIKQNL